MEPYILLPVLLPDRFVRYDAPVEKSSERVYTKKEILPFNLNTADTSQLKQIFGIGDVLSERIVKYRMQLGGFISVTQLKEVYRLDSATITRLLDHAFIEESFRPAGININLATEAELVRHPYISGSMAKAIVAYRFQHGKFDSLDELRKLVVVTATEREKIKPYLIVE